MTVDPAGSGTPAGTSVIAYSSFGLVPGTRCQTYLAVALDDTAVCFAEQGPPPRPGAASRCLLPGPNEVSDASEEEAQ